MSGLNGLIHVTIHSNSDINTCINQSINQSIKSHFLVPRHNGLILWFSSDPFRTRGSVPEEWNVLFWPGGSRACWEGLLALRSQWDVEAHCWRGVSPDALWESHCRHPVPSCSFCRTFRWNGEWNLEWVLQLLFHREVTVWLSKGQHSLIQSEHCFGGVFR